MKCFLPFLQSETEIQQRILEVGEGSGGLCLAVFLKMAGNCWGHLLLQCLGFRDGVVGFLSSRISYSFMYHEINFSKGRLAWGISLCKEADTYLAGMFSSWSRCLLWLLINSDLLCFCINLEQ